MTGTELIALPGNDYNIGCFPFTPGSFGGAAANESCTLKNAITGVYPNYTIDYSMALVSRGDLPNATAPVATVSGTAQVQFTWTDNTGIGKAAATDRSMLVLYYPARKQCIFTTLGSDCSTANATIDASAFAGQMVQTYIGFISVDDKEISNSFFTGQVSIP